MVSVRKMKSGDAKRASKATREIALDCWEKYEKDYYPTRALDFEISVHSHKYNRDSVKRKRTSRLLPRKTLKLLE